jgi:signal transduction histidine kinase
MSSARRIRGGGWTRNVSPVRGRTVSRWSIPVVDVILAAVVTAYALHDVLGNHSWFGPEWLSAVLVGGACASLALRRRYPTTVLAIVGSVIAGLGWKYGSPQTWSSGFPFVIAVYSAAAYSRHVVTTAVLLVVTVVVRDLNDPYISTIRDLDFTATLTVLTVLAGVEGRRLAARSAHLDQRAEVLEREEEARAAAIVAAERQRIARELHDIVSHGLGVMVLQAGAAEQVLDKDPDRARAALRAIRATGQDSIGEMGTLLDLVQGGAERSREPQPCLADVPALVHRLQSTGLDVRCRIDPELPKLSPVTELSAFRVVQEGLTNVTKYAPKSSAAVDVGCTTDALEVSVTDDGEGALAAAGSRRGLLGLAERVSVLGGQFSAGPREERGWQIKATFPVHR